MPLVNVHDNKNIIISIREYIEDPKLSLGEIMDIRCMYKLAKDILNPDKEIMFATFEPKLEANEVVDYHDDFL